MTNPLQIRPGDGGANDPVLPEASDAQASGGGLAPLFEAEVQGGTGGPSGTRPQRNISRGRLVWLRFRRKKLALLGVVMLVLIALLAWIGPYLTHWKVDSLDNDFTQVNRGPTSHHWFGSDQIGHDLFIQTISGLQKSLTVGLVAALLSTFVAAVVGSLAGYFGKLTNTVLIWIVDMMLVVPSFLILAIISPKLRGKSFLLFAVLLAAFSWMITARVVRGLTLSLREREFVSAARFMGVHPITIIRRHILPNMASFLIVDVTLNVGGAILAETSLSYFGFGVQAPAVTLGTLIADGTANPGTSQPYLWAFPGMFLILIVLAVNFVGDGLRDALDATSGVGQG
jgi:peptide/nickel transport system permease protein